MRMDSVKVKSTQLLEEILSNLEEYNKLDTKYEYDREDFIYQKALTFLNWTPPHYAVNNIIKFLEFKNGIKIHVNVGEPK